MNKWISCPSCGGDVSVFFNHPESFTGGCNDCTAVCVSDVEAVCNDNLKLDGNKGALVTLDPYPILWITESEG